jgi:hypothetical protein
MNDPYFHFKKFGKRKRGYLFFLTKINNIINILIIKLNFYGRIGDADVILDVRTNSLRSAS